MQWVTPRQYYNPFTCSTGLLNRLVQRHGPPSRVREQGHNPSQSEKEQLYQLRDLATRGHQFTDNSIFIMLSSCIYSVRVTTSEKRLQDSEEKGGMNDRMTRSHCS